MSSKAIQAAVLAAISTFCPVTNAATQDTQQAAQTQSAPESGAKPAAESDPAKAQAASPAAIAASAADDRTFIVGPEDQLDVQVWGNPGIGGPVLVRPDGRISVTLVGEVQAAGRTPLELSADIAEVLKEKDILRRPQVTVKVLEVRSKKYRINGEVMKTGEFPLVVPTRIMEALVNAGGFKDFANKKDIVIIRGTERLKFNWNEVVKGKKLEQNVFLQHGDIIIVK